MRVREWIRPPRHVLVVFLAVSASCAVALAWLGWHLLEHDQVLEAQHAVEHLDHSADHLTGVLQRALADLEAQLPALAAEPGKKAPPERVILVVATSQEVQAYPARQLLYYPVAPPADEVPGAVFAAGEAAEYQQNDPAQAAEIFRVQARSPNGSVRAGALLRLGRNLRKLRRHREALEAYEELARLGPARVGGRPAELAAHEARCRAWLELRQPEELKREAAVLFEGLFSGRWRVDRAAWELHVAEARSWLGRGHPTPDEQSAKLLADAVDRVWSHWTTDPASRGRRFLTVAGTAILVAWSATAERLTALVSEPDYLRSLWRRELKLLGVQATLTDGEGRVVLGYLGGEARPHAVRGPAATGLPWTVEVAGPIPEPELSTLASRRRLMLTGFAAFALLVAAGSYFILRVMARELAVAHLQSEFVAAVSHEFRTPLTSLRQLSELLAKDRVPASQRQRTYEILNSETERLHGLVEELLDFARMEAGAVNYRLESVETGELLASLAAGFRQQVAPQGYQVEFDAPTDLPTIRADREALTRAVWNLLDNAVKYSPECRTVWLEAARQDGGLAIRVRDCGVGIPAAERKEIFRKFVRGKSPGVDRVKGTGLGLAMVAHVVRAHGGEIRVESEPGQGSTFTLLLPLEEKV